jgi:hypothetical protein
MMPIPDKAYHSDHSSSARAQKPSSARPTQLNANSEQTTAVTDATAAIAFADDMSRILVRHQILSNDFCSKMAENSPRQKRAGSAGVATLDVACPQKPAIPARSEGIRRGIQHMYRLADGGVRNLVLATFVGALLTLVVMWLALRGSPPQLARDFEECLELVQANSPPNDEFGTLKTECKVRFAGRRKANGGYTYYDFMQNRNFDIVGPNPTAEERKQIDREYMGYLDAQRREAVSAGLAIRQSEQLRADIEIPRLSVGPPMVLTPANSPSTAKKHLVDRWRAARCGDDSLSCRWAKFSTAVKNAFASSTKTKP